MEDWKKPPQSSFFPAAARIHRHRRFNYKNETNEIKKQDENYPADPCRLLKESSVGSRVVCFHHIDGECIVSARISKTICDIGLCLSVTADILDI